MKLWPRPINTNLTVYIWGEESPPPLCEQGGFCPWMPHREHCTESEFITYCCQRPTSDHSSLTAACGFREKQMRMSSENKMFCPCSSPWGKDYSTSKTWKLFVMVFKCSGALNAASEKNPYGLKYKIAFSASCLLLSCHAYLLFSPLPHLHLPWQSEILLTSRYKHCQSTHPPSSAFFCADKGDPCKQAGAVQWCCPATALLKMPSLDGSKSERLVLGYIWNIQLRPS